MTRSVAPETIEAPPLARLRPHAKNAKIHGEDQVAKIASSIAEFDRTVPVPGSARAIGERWQRFTGGAVMDDETRAFPRSTRAAA